MQVAAFLSDLKSLSVCSYEAAMNLVTVYKASNESEAIESTISQDRGQQDIIEENDDRRRADELALLHQNVKLKHIRTPDVELVDAKEGIRRILQDLNHD